MTVAAVFLLGSTGIYCGFQWTIRMVVYPQFAVVPHSSFAAYERAHQARVTIAVGSLFLLAGGSAIAAFVAHPDAASAVAAAAIAAVVAVTGLFAVPQHRLLSQQFDAEAYARLLRVDTVRLAFAVVACLAAAAYALQAG